MKKSSGHIEGAISVALSEYDGGDDETPPSYGNFDRALFLSHVAGYFHAMHNSDAHTIAQCLDIIAEELGS